MQTFAFIFLNLNFEIKSNNSTYRTELKWLQNKLQYKTLQKL